MSQTPEGISKYKKTMIEKFGSEQAWKEHMRSLGSRGGKRGTGHQFGHGRVDPSEVGRKGGLKSRKKTSKD